MKQQIITGRIKDIKNYDHGDGLRIGTEILSETLEELNDKQVTVRFYISDEERSKSEMQENLILSIAGGVEAKYGDAYSEYTGYLWTDDELKIGNHDLIETLANYDGKYCYLEIDIHE